MARQRRLRQAETRRVRAAAPETLRDWIPLVYEKACERAHRLLCKWSGVNRPGTASLVHQAYYRLSECGVERCASREHALALLVQKMRHQLCDLARRIDARKRGGRGAERDGQPALHRPFLADQPAQEGTWEAADYLALEEALARLQQLSPRLAQLVELRFLIGLSLQETADELGISRMSVHNDWQLAKAWLYKELAGEKSGK
ncbi:MAG: sigma-70 family RNA polymerase sigma factor [Planctomycetota bacterium]